MLRGDFNVKMKCALLTLIVFPLKWQKSLSVFKPPIPLRINEENLPSLMSLWIMDAISCACLTPYSTD